MQFPPTLAFFLLAVLGIGSGCAHVVERPLSARADSEQIDFGAPPTDGDRENIKILLQREVVDPTQLEFRFVPPMKCEIEVHGHTFFGWKQPLVANPWNRYDGLSYESFVFFFRDGKIIARRGQFRPPPLPER